MADIYRIERTRDYTVMGRFHLWDRNLTMKAKGLLCFILSTPENWKLSTEGLAYYMKDSVDAVRSALKELERNGYVNRKRTRDEKGRISNTLFSIYEKPEMNPHYTLLTPGSSDTTDLSADPDDNPPYVTSPYMDKPHMENPDVENPDVENPSTENPSMATPQVENPRQINSNRPNIDIPNKKKERNNTASMYQSNQDHIHHDDDPDIDAIYEELKSNFLYSDIEICTTRNSTFWHTKMYTPMTVV